jgi:hypothetical protein
MPKLHEILAVEGDLEATAKKVIEEAVVTFSKKSDHFLESHRSLVFFDEARDKENVEEHSEMVTTVADKLKYVQRHITKYWDTFAKKETTNQNAKADLVIDGEVLATELPATMLLGLESKLKIVRALYEAIPTLQPGMNWQLDPDRGEHIYKTAEPETRMRTEKQVQVKVTYEATKEHPAQLETWNADVSVGKISVTHWSGMISPAEKSQVLGRIDTLIRGVKRARQRANTTDVVKTNIGEILFNYING